MKNIFVLLLFISQILLSQKINRVEWDFPKNQELKSKNLLDKYVSYNFSKIWTLTDSNTILGIIGNDHQRIKVKLISVEKNSKTPYLYSVVGKSFVKGTICNFDGFIKLVQIKEVKELHFGVDDEYAKKGIKSQGILIANYEFKENSEQKHSGIFKGKLYSKWYLNSKNKIEYDKIQIFSNGYLNNAFIGTWKSHTTNKEKICNWADYRVPISNSDFDVGAGEFSPSEKYFSKGWAKYKPLQKDEWWK